MARVFEMLVVVATLALSFRRVVLLLAALVRPRPIPRPHSLPTVAVMAPARNEATVAARFLDALARLDYPVDKLSFVLVCDGCSDETPALFRAWSAERGDTTVLGIPRQGKAAALNAAFRVAEAEIVVVVDADLVPRKDFLLELVRPFADARVGAAAAFLHPLNADATVVSRYAAVTTWVHQLITSAGTDRLGLDPPTLGGAAYRRAALQEIGGFPHVPVGVDVAASSALIRRGWRTRFVASSVAGNTVVSRLRGFWRQHIRWGRAVHSVGHSRHTHRTSLANRLESVAAAIGYGDRLVFAAGLAGALGGAVPLWVPLAYLAVRGLEIVAALGKAHVSHRLHAFLAASLLMFPADVIASLVASMAHIARRPYRWHHSRGDDGSVVVPNQ